MNETQKFQGPGRHPAKISTASLRRKLLTWLFFPLLFLWLVGAAVAYYLALNFSNIAYDRSLLGSTRALAEQVKTVDGRAVVELPRAALDILQSDEHDKVYYQVIGADGQLLAGTPKLPLPEAGNLAGTPQFHEVRLNGQKVRIAAIHLDIAGNAPGPILVQVGETLNKRKILAGEVLTGVMLPQLILILLAALAVRLGIGRGLAPLQRLRQEIANRSHRDLSPVPELDTPQEVRPIIHAINELMERLGNALEAQQRFIADAAHQLRTPLAGLKTQTELALRQTDPEQMRHALLQLKTSAERTSRLVAQVLALARAEYGMANRADLKPLDLNRLARETTMEWVPEAVKKNIDLGYEGSEQPVLIDGDEVRLKMLLDNLLDNAIRYCPSGCRVTARVTEGSEKTLTVEDNGPGIPPAEKELVFQRFYRVLGNQNDGSGLGLAIVKEIAEIHQARISLDTPPEGRGTAIKIAFPR